MTLHWVGGMQTSHQLVRPVQTYQQMADYAKLRARIEELRQQGRSMAQVAACLNQEGFQPPKRGLEQFTSEMVGIFLGPRMAAAGRARVACRRKGCCGEWLLTDLARELNMPAATLHRWRKVHWIHARKLPVRERPLGPLGQQRGAVIRLRRLRQFQQRSWEVKKGPPIALTTPKAPCP